MGLVLPSRPAERPDPWTIAVHGHGVALLIDPPAVAQAASGLLAPLVEPQLPGQPDVYGTVLAYEESDVMRHISSDAVRLEHVDPLLELYRDSEGGEKFWLVDERWGLCEINLLKRTWRSWIVPEPTCDVLRLVESAVLWPMAQLLRGFGLHLLPAVAVGRERKGVLILSPYEIGPELEALAEAGIGLIGQRWTAVREADFGRVELLGLPGRTQLCPAPRPLSAGPMGEPQWVDLSSDGRGCHHAFCEMVLLVEPMRRSRAGTEPLHPSAAREQLKQRWPMPQLSANRRAITPTNQLAARLSKICPVHRVRLSRDPQDLVRMLVRAPGQAADRAVA